MKRKGNDTDGVTGPYGDSRRPRPDPRNGADDAPGTTTDGSLTRTNASEEATGTDTTPPAPEGGSRHRPGAEIRSPHLSNRGDVAVDVDRRTMAVAP